MQLKIKLPIGSGILVLVTVIDLSLELIMPGQSKDMYSLVKQILIESPLNSRHSAGTADSNPPKELQVGTRRQSKSK